mmetsp:Transcript_48737/g.116004  ORF Transcript_48737/g.116004 Transcript_48737/m.116004 type:complete len:269 (-) Transcript_48737:343-1149(-)
MVCRRLPQVHALLGELRGDVVVEEEEHRNDGRGDDRCSDVPPFQLAQPLQDEVVLGAVKRVRDHQPPGDCLGELLGDGPGHGRDVGEQRPDQHEHRGTVVGNEAAEEPWEDHPVARLYGANGGVEKPASKHQRKRPVEQQPRLLLRHPVSDAHFGAPRGSRGEEVRVRGGELRRQPFDCLLEEEERNEDAEELPREAREVVRVEARVEHREEKEEEGCPEERHARPWQERDPVRLGDAEHVVVHQHDRLRDTHDQERLAPEYRLHAPA